MKSSLQILNEGFDRKYLSEAYNPEEYDDELVLNADDLFVSCYGDEDLDSAFDECLEEGAKGEAIGGAIGAYIGHPILGAKAGSAIEDTAVKYAKDRFNKFKKDNNIEDDEDAYAELVKRGSKKAAEIGTKIGKKAGKAITNRFKRSKLTPATESLSEAITECLSRLNEASVDPQTYADTDVLKSIQNKINGKKFNLKNLSSEEQDVLSRYGLDVWGFKGDTKMVTPGANDILDPGDGWKRHDAFRKGKVNLADRASKLDDRAKNYDIQRAYTGNSNDTYQNKNNAYVSHQMGKDRDRLKTALRNRHYAKNQLDKEIDNSYLRHLDTAQSDYDKKIKELSNDETRYQAYTDEQQSKIQALLDKRRARLSKKIGECLSRMNEASMSDQDKKDNAILKQIQTKIDSRRNAKLTPEEQEVLDRLGIIRGWDDLYVNRINSSGKSYPKRITPVGASYGTWKYRYDNQNLADKARKWQKRPDNAVYSTLDNERSIVNGEISSDTDAMKSYLRDRNYWQKKVDSAVSEKDKASQELKRQQLASARYRQDSIARNQKYLDNAQSTIDSILADKRKRESYLKEDVENTSVINTGLDSVIGADKAHDIIDGILGQISDGIWENTPGQDKYWQFADAQGSDIVVDRGYKNDRYTRNGYIDSGFRFMSDEEVKKFFGNRIKTAAQMYLNDNNLNPYKNWNENCEEICSYLSDGSGVTVGDCYKAFKVLTGRI